MLPTNTTILLLSRAFCGQPRRKCRKPKGKKEIILALLLAAVTSLFLLISYGSGRNGSSPDKFNNILGRFSFWCRALSSVLAIIRVVTVLCAAFPL